MRRRGVRPLVPGSRRQAIEQVRRRLLREGWPRLQMLLLVAVTGAAGFVASWALLHGGYHSMVLRYPLALGAAYLVFLLLLWLWLRGGAEDCVDAWDGSLPDPPGSASSARPDWGGHGGHSGGGGAGAHFDAGTGGSATMDGDGGVLDAITEPVGQALGSAAEADEMAVPIAAVALAIGLLVCVLLSALLVVWSAPVLFAELLVDGVLAAGLYRRLRHIHTRHWLETAVRRTALPFALTAVLAATAGWGMAKWVPGAESIGDVIGHTAAPR